MSLPSSRIPSSSASAYIGKKAVEYMVQVAPLGTDVPSPDRMPPQQEHEYHIDDMSPDPKLFVIHESRDKNTATFRLVGCSFRAINMLRIALSYVRCYAIKKAEFEKQNTIECQAHLHFTTTNLPLNIDGRHQDPTRVLDIGIAIEAGDDFSKNLERHAGPVRMSYIDCTLFRLLPAPPVGPSAQEEKTPKPIHNELAFELHSTVSDFDDRKSVSLEALTDNIEKRQAFKKGDIIATHRTQDPTIFSIFRPKESTIQTSTKTYLLSPPDQSPMLIGHCKATLSSEAEAAKDCELQWNLVSSFSKVNANLRLMLMNSDQKNRWLSPDVAYLKDPKNDQIDTASSMEWTSQDRVFKSHETTIPANTEKWNKLCHLVKSACLTNVIDTEVPDIEDANHFTTFHVLDPHACTRCGACVKRDVSKRLYMVDTTDGNDNPPAFDITLVTPNCTHTPASVLSRAFEFMRGHTSEEFANKIMSRNNLPASRNAKEIVGTHQDATHIAGPLMGDEEFEQLMRVDRMCVAVDPAWQHCAATRTALYQDYFVKAKAVKTAFRS